MTRNPPFSLDGLTLDELMERTSGHVQGSVSLAVDVDELFTECRCDVTTMDRPTPMPGDPDPDWPDHVPDDPDIAEPTIIRSYDKWWLKQCKTCGAIFWRHDVRGDYGIPEMDNR